MRFSHKRQQGVALLVALLVVALAVILIAALLDRGELAYARTRNTLRGEQAEAYAQGLEIYSAQILRSLQNDHAGVDTNMSPWALPLPPQPVPGGLIRATMRDLNGCFNLNNLSPRNTNSRQSWNKIFLVLLKQLEIDPAIDSAVGSWLDPNADSSDANFYLAQPVAYRPRRDVFAHVSELRLVRGVSSEVYAKLAPHVCVLPPNTLLNVNTADLAVLSSLSALSPSITPATAVKLWNDGHANYNDLSQFAGDLSNAGASDSSLGTSPLLATTSTYFLARGDVTLNEVPFTFYSLIERGSSGGIRVIERSRGSDDALSAPAPIAPDPNRSTTLD